MAAKDFVKFYSEYLPTKPALKKEIDESTDQRAFLSAVLDQGKKAGFNFTEKDVDQVIRASLSSGALSDSQLEGVAGGASTTQIPVVRITTISSVNNIASRVGNAASGTVMCTGWGMPAGSVERGGV
jgi:hypothetical protein